MVWCCFLCWCVARERAMMSGFKITRMILTSCQNHSVRNSLPCCHYSANQTSAECCLEFTAAISRSGRLSRVPWAVWVSSSPSHGAP